MKKTVFATLALLALGAGSAFAQVTVGAGYLNNTSKTEITNADDSKTSSDAVSNGFYVNGDYTVDLSHGLGLSLGLQGSYLTRTKNGEASALGLASGSYESTTKEIYIAMPVDVKYSYALTPDFKLFAFAGPTFSYGVSSKTETKVTVTALGASSTSTSNSDNYNDDNATLKPFNIFVGGGVGADVMDCIRVKGGYDYGLLNGTSADNTTLHQSRWYVGLSFIF